MNIKTILLLTLAITLTFQQYTLEQLLSMSDQDLFNAALNLKTGDCYLSDARNCGACACDYYAKVKLPSGNQGLPDKYGSGCVVAPNLPKQMGYCWDTPNTYPNYQNTIRPICTTDHVKNGANMIRIGLLKGYCNLPDPCSQLTTFINMSDQDLFNAALNLKTANCYLSDARNCGACACDYYAKVMIPSGNQGLPDKFGSGCLVASNLPKQMGYCWDTPNTYPNYSNTDRAICDPIDYIKNGANMIRIGL